MTSQLISNLKREKTMSKYLKTIVVHGMKLDKNAMKKEGFSLGEIASGRLKIG